MQDKCFWDTNLWIYLFVRSQNKGDLQKREVLVKLLQEQQNITSSAQVLNEVGNVLMKKFGNTEEETKGFLDQVCSLANPIDLSKEITYSALRVKKRYQLSWFDSLIVAAALESNSIYLYSEDMHSGLKIDNKLTIVNPFI